MQHLLLIGAVFILLIILFIVIFLIIREVLQRTHHRQRRRLRQVGFRVIRNQAEFDEFRRGMYVPRIPVIRVAPDSGIDDVDTSPSSGEVYHWSASSGGSSTVTPPSRGVALDVSRRFKAVSFADSLDLSQIDYEEHSAGRPQTSAGVARLYDRNEPKLTSFSSGGRKFAKVPQTPQKAKNVRRPTPSAHEQESVMREFEVIEESEEADLTFEPITSL